MIGVPGSTPEGRVYPSPRGLVEVLEGLGFNSDGSAGVRVNIHYETFW
jgi:hypothetical protein